MGVNVINLDEFEFSTTKQVKKYIALFPVRIKKNWKTSNNIPVTKKKTLVISITCRKYKNENEKLSKE